MGMEIDTDGPGINMADVFSPFFWGFVVSLFCTGITVVQAYIYFPHPTDGRVVQSIVAFMLVLDLVSSGLIAQSLYYYLIPHYGSVAQLNSVTPELTAECLISSIITFISQMFFVYQIHKVNQDSRTARIVVRVIAVGAVLTLIAGCGCVSMMVVFQHGVLSNRSRTFSIVFGIAKGLGSITDLVATVSMCALLSVSKTGISVQTNKLIKSLIILFVNRGILVTVVQSMILIMFYAVPSKLWWLAFHINVTRLYANTFFAMLNARKVLKKKSAEGSGVRSIPGVTSKSYDLENNEKPFDTLAIMKTQTITTANM